MGCKSNFIETRAEVSENVATVVTVQWRTNAASTGYVEYGLTDSYGMQTPITDEGTDHKVVLLGLHSDEVYHYRVVSDGLTSEDLIVETGSLPAELPSLTLQGDPNSWQGYIPVPLLGTINASLVIDNTGEIVWYHILEDDSRGPRRVRLSTDGSGVLFNSIADGSDSNIYWTTWDQTDTSQTLIEDHNHDFIEKSNGDIIAMVYDTVDINGEPKRGDKLVNLTPGGKVTDLWSMWDDYEYDMLPNNNTGWTHANALRYDEENEAVYLGLRNFSTILKIDAVELAVEWSLGDSPISDYTFAEGTEPFLRQHHFQFIEDDRLLVFDNHNVDDNESRIVEYQIDHDTQTVEEVWRFEHDPGLTIYALGEAYRTDDEDTFINWSVAGEMQRVSAAGDVEWQLNTDLGYAFGYSTPVDSMYAQ